MSRSYNMFTLVDLPYCKVILVESWNAPAGRYFVAYNAADNYRFAIGLPVIDEFATFSSPIYFCPTPFLGKIYNAGITLGHNRDPEMGIDLGWPPLVVGYDAHAVELPVNWEQELLMAIKKAEVQMGGGAEEYQLKKLKVETIEVFVTNAPLLPKQLKRIAQKSNAPFSIAISTGNRLTGQQNSTPLTVNALSEQQLSQILASEAM
ncbi:MAG TPA: hypothetical protein VLH08_17755 [Acidobacteriota bacterium]|nr:hypothetical protein [Acidobacteriota bacterium]